MNYGKYFRLNLQESRIVEGIAIYDYTDLPAFFGDTSMMSPKYPITLCVSSDSLRFRLHFCAYSGILSDKKRSHSFLYTNVENGETNLYGLKDEKRGDIVNVETVHMQEVILELPFANNSMQPIENTIKQIYNTRFPYNASIISEEGSAYLAKLLTYRYESSNDLSSANNSMYSELRHFIDSDRSYSTLWLMGLREDAGDGKYRFNLKSPQMTYVGVLRKILLDFMFDLKHSDVFQSSSSYQQMYSGLMSDFYFKALMHKCEYYYYRGLTLDAISQVELRSQQLKESSKKEKALRRMDTCEEVDKKQPGIGFLELFKRRFKIKRRRLDEEKKNALSRIRELYAANLFDAEKEWVEDILSPQAEKAFQIEEDDFRKEPLPLGKRLKQWKDKNIIEPLHNGLFITRPSWFADPEEELRRVCFTMIEKGSQKKHICNAETVAEYLKLQNRVGVADVKSRISRWFLKRNAFLDVLHLHYFRYGNYLVLALLFSLAIVIVSFSAFLRQDFWHNNPIIAYSVFGIWGVCILATFVYWLISLINKKKYLGDSILVGVRKRFVAKRTLWWMIITGMNLFLLYSAINANEEYLESETLVPWALAAAGVMALAALIMLFFSGFRIIQNVHLLFPRLIAAIAAAWLTLAIGNELFQSFFDTIPSWLSCSLLSIIVLLFIIYEMNRIVPRESIVVKVSRSVGLLVISFVLSILVGLFIINFTGERFLERSEYLGTFYDEYVENGHNKSIDAYRQIYRYSGEPFKDSTNLGYLNHLKDVSIARELDDVTLPQFRDPVVNYWIIGSYRFFILRDFLIQFAFLAMFIGVFIQMIFEEKSITEM